MKNFGFSHTPDEEMEIVNSITKKSPIFANEQDEFVSLIFAPDSETGNPNSSLAMYVKTQNSEVRDFIRNKFFTDAGVGSSGVDSPDFALDTVKYREESNLDYVDRLHDLFVAETSKS